MKVRLFTGATVGLAAALLASTALAQQSGHKEGTLPSGFPYQITVPENWNGIVINDLDAVSNIESELAQYLLDNGYAYTGTGRHPERMTKHDPLTELDAQVAVLDLVSQNFGEPKHTIQYGCSGGGFVALAMAELHPEAIDAAISLNSRGTGGMAVANSWLDLPYTLKALLAPDSDLLVAPVPNDALPAAYDAWKAVMDEAQATPEGRARIALAVAISQWPTWGAISVDEAPERPAEDLAAQQAAMFRSASDGLSNSVNRRQLYDNPAGLASWNTGISYANLYEVGADPAQKELVRQLYEEAGLGEDGLAADLEQIDAQPRIEGSPEGVNYWAEPGRLLSGDIKVPLLHIHGLGDALLPPHALAGYQVAVEQQGHDELYRTGFIDAAGHCATSVAEGMTAINTVLERLKNGEWPETGSEALNAAATSLGLETPRFVEHSFATPFNRAFYADTERPF